MPIFSVDSKKCRKDGICAKACPAGLIEGKKGELPAMRTGSQEQCIACGHCIAFCPHQAAHVDVLEDSALLAPGRVESRELNRRLLPDTEAVELLCASRRSIRHFADKPVSKDLITRVLDVARYAPTAKNRQPVRWVVLHDPVHLLRMGEGIAAWLEELTAGGIAPETFPEAGELLQAWRSGNDPFFRKAPHLLLAVTPKDWEWGTIDASIALTYVEIVALAHNLGTCWAGYVTLAAQAYAPLQELLGVKSGEVVSGGQMLGYAALRPSAVPPRPRPPVAWL